MWSTKCVSAKCGIRSMDSNRKVRQKRVKRMKFKSIEKREQGHFITRYDLTYETAGGTEKVYEMISRDADITDFASLHDRGPDAVVLIMHSEDGEKVLLNREFRLAPGEWVYNFPAGLIDPGENPEEAAALLCELDGNTAEVEQKYLEMGSYQEETNGIFDMATFMADNQFIENAPESYEDLVFDNVKGN